MQRRPIDPRVQESLKPNDSFPAQITAPGFTAGIVIRRESASVVLAAPIVRYMLGWSEARVKGYCQTRGWKFKEIKT